MLAASAMETLGYVSTASFTYVGIHPVLAWPISHTFSLVMLVLVTAGLLLGPKFLALFVILRAPAARRGHGGAAKLVASVLLESVFSTLLAPVFMLTHSWFVVNILSGRSAQWNAQARDDHRPSLGAVTRLFLPHTIIGAGLDAAFYFYAGDGFWWMLPIVAGLVLSIPLVFIASDPKFGLAARRLGLFLIPSEVSGLPILDRVRAIVVRNRTAAFTLDAERAEALHALLAAENGPDPRRYRPAA
jgi:membrane glycosyltransferase